MTDVAPDGSPAAFYRRLPASGEPELIDAAIEPGATVLDLGCGTGRIAGPLGALGHQVTGVDNGPAMIAALPPSVEGIVADARTVRLGRRFGRYSDRPTSDTSAAGFDASFRTIAILGPDRLAAAQRQSVRGEVDGYLR